MLRSMYYVRDNLSNVLGDVGQVVCMMYFIYESFLQCALFQVVRTW